MIAKMCLPTMTFQVIHWNFGILPPLSNPEPISMVEVVAM
jgi:hypothetical protein